MSNKAFISTPDGIFAAVFSAAGLARLEFPGAAGAAPRAGGRMAAEAPLSRQEMEARQALLRLLAGEEPVAYPPLDLSGGTEFQQRVWRFLREIPMGQTVTYGEIARALGCEGGARAVGQACGANPIPVLVPCHRVLAAGGGLGGFSGGLEWKIKLLQRERVHVSPVH